MSQYHRIERHEFDTSLYNYGLDLSSKVLIEDSTYEVKDQILEKERFKEFPFRLNQVIYRVLNSQGKLLERSHDNLQDDSIPFFPEMGLKKNYTHRYHDFEVEKNFYRAVNIKLTNAQGNEVFLQVAAVANVLYEKEQRLVYINIILVCSLILISSIVSYLMAADALTPIKALIDSANSIAAGNLSKRVPVSPTEDEIQELSQTLNNLLERLEKSFKAQEKFVSNASHQLNTPLAIIKGELDVLTSKERSLDEHKKFLSSLNEETQRLSELVKNMLLLSRVEAGIQSFTFRPLRLDELLVGVYARFETKAKQKDIQLKLNIIEPSGPDEYFKISGERQLLEALVENLIDNAIKYSPSSTIIQISILQDENKISISVEDEGPGMTSDQAEKFLEHRFSRGDNSDTLGTGLGLNIAHVIAHYHQAQILYTQLHPRGSRFEVVFPL